MIRTAALLCVLVCATAPAAEEDKKAGAAAGLDHFKQLSGDWVGKEVKGPNQGTEIRATYKVTAAGSAVIETLFPGADHEMITMIHRDGDELLLTHYCALGNQPHMKAAAAPNGNQVAFKFVRATNLKSPNDPHMHDVIFTFVDKDAFRSEWTYFRDGKASGTVVFEMKRKK